VILVIVVATLSLAFRANQAVSPVDLVVATDPDARPFRYAGGRGLPSGRRVGPAPGRERAGRKQPHPRFRLPDPGPSPTPARICFEPAARLEPESFPWLTSGPWAPPPAPGSPSGSSLTERSLRAQLRVLFSTPDKRSQVQGGWFSGVRFDPTNHQKIVLDLPEA